MANTRRLALQEITTTSERVTPPSTMDHLQNVLISDLILTPVSPDEEVIRSRGRYRKTIITTSEDELQLTPKKNSAVKSPKKICRTPNKSPQKQTPSVPSRTSPRKRLNLQDLDLQPSSTSADNSPNFKCKRSVVKKLKLQSSPVKPSNVDGTLASLSHSQLVNLIKTLIVKHPEIKDTVEEDIPVPDLSPLEDKLNTLQRNIFRSIPSTRWESNRDSFCFRRTSIHLESFKKECVEQGHKLIRNQQWNPAIEYVVMAWRYVRSLPDWDNVAHNKSKSQCFKVLAAICLTAIKNMTFDESEILDRLSIMVVDSDCLTPCLKYLEEKVRTR